MNHGLSPPKRHGVHATGNCCFTLAQSSPSRRFRYFRATRCRSVSTLIDATRSPSCLQAHAAAPVPVQHIYESAALDSGLSAASITRHLLLHFTSPNNRNRLAILMSWQIEAVPVEGDKLRKQLATH